MQNINKGVDKNINKGVDKDKNKDQQTLIVSEHHDGQRLDNFLLRSLKSVPKSLIYRLLRKGYIRVNKKKAKPLLKLCEQDIITVPALRMSEPKQLEISQDIVNLIKQQIIYEDNYLLIINKPAGMAVHGGSKVSCGVIEACKKIYEGSFIELIHRLDKETSGCLVMAKKSSVLKDLNKMLAEGQIKKTYHALVYGRWPKACHKIDLPLTKKIYSSNEHKTIVDKISGKASLTTVSVLKQFSNIAALMSLHPKTGRTHQLRVHTKEIGCPVIGDVKYGYSKDKNKDKDKDKNKNKNSGLPVLPKSLKVNRMFLHAYQIKFTHPATGELVVAQAPYDDKTEIFISNLGRSRV